MTDDNRFKADLTSAETFEMRAAARDSECYVLSLYVAGMTFRSTRAVDRIRSFCERRLSGRYELTVIDLYLHPEVAKKAQIIVAPTLVREAPSPKRLFIGDMADETQILVGLNVVR
jgi:circadian clock protein KaiB